jgi:hypothetical protein
MEHSKLFESLLEEHVVNAFSPEDQRKYGDQVFDVLQKSYAYIGGVKGVNNVEDLIKEAPFWKIDVAHGHVLAVNCYKFTSHGRKMVCGGSDGSDEGKYRFKRMLANDSGYSYDRPPPKPLDDSNNNGLPDELERLHPNLVLKGRQAYVEVSDAMEHIMKNKWKLQAIPVERAAEILGPSKKLFPPTDKDGNPVPPDGYHYSRLLGGEMHTKIMFGNPDFKPS